MPGLLEYLYGDHTTTTPHTTRWDARFPIICSNEEPQQHCLGKYPCYIAAFRKWAAATKAAAIALGVMQIVVEVLYGNFVYHCYLLKLTRTDFPRLVSP